MNLECSLLTAMSCEDIFGKTGVWGWSLDIGEYEDPKKNFFRTETNLLGKETAGMPLIRSATRKQLENLWSSGAIDFKTPSTERLNPEWWNYIQMLGMRVTKEHLDCKLRKTVNKGSHFTFGERSIKPGNDEIEIPGTRRTYRNTIFVLMVEKKIRI